MNDFLRAFSLAVSGVVNRPLSSSSNALPPPAPPLRLPPLTFGALSANTPPVLAAVASGCPSVRLVVARVKLFVTLNHLLLLAFALAEASAASGSSFASKSASVHPPSPRTSPSLVRRPRSVPWLLLLRLSLALRPLLLLVLPWRSPEEGRRCLRLSALASKLTRESRLESRLDARLDARLEPRLDVRRSRPREDCSPLWLWLRRRPWPDRLRSRGAPALPPSSTI